jgi:hypothetical protein
MERINLQNLNEIEGKERYRVEDSNWVPALKDFNAEVDINSVWQTVERIPKFQPKSLESFQMNKHMRWSDGGCSTILYQGKKSNSGDYRIQAK